MDTHTDLLLHWCTHWPPTNTMSDVNSLQASHASNCSCTICTVSTNIQSTWSCLNVCLCACSLGCYSGRDCSPPWDTEDRTDPQCSPVPRLRHTHPHSHRNRTTLLSRRSRCVFACVFLCMYTRVSLFCVLCNVFFTGSFGLLCVVSRYSCRYFMTWMTQNLHRQMDC